MIQLLLEIIIIVSVNMFSTIDMMLIMRLFFGMETCKKRWQFILFAGTFVLIHILMYTFRVGDSMLYTILLFAHMISIALLLSPKRRLKALLCMIPALWIYIQYGILILMVEELFPIKMPAMIIVQGKEYSFLNISSDVILMLLLIAGIIYSKKKNLLQPISFWETIFLTAFCFISPIFLEILKILMDVRQSTFRNVVWVLLIVGVNVVVIYGIFYRRKARYYKSLSGNYKEQFDSELTYFKEYKEGQQETTKFRHDWKNHMLIMQSMLDHKEYEKAQKYFEELSEGMKSVSGHFLTGNEIVDIILNAKSDIFEESEIKVECDGGMEGLKFIEAADCCILFSNLIDNAIEANLLCEDNRFIKIKTDEKPGHLRIVVENAMVGDVNEYSEGLYTTKEEPGHGIGTRNAFAIIKKYQGEYEVVAKDGIFSLYMVFPHD